MIYKDNILDKTFVDQLASDLRNKVRWQPNNSASRSYPYNENLEYVLLGHKFFNRVSLDIIEYGEDMEFNKKLINLFYHLKDAFNKPNIMLEQIAGNLQFKGMDGGLHMDGYKEDNKTSFILMLSPDYDVENDGGVFYNETQNKEIAFKHGRVVEIESSDLHLGKAFDSPYKMRFSLRFTGG